MKYATLSSRKKQHLFSICIYFTKPDTDFAILHAWSYCLYSSSSGDDSIKGFLFLYNMHTFLSMCYLSNIYLTHLYAIVCSFVSLYVFVTCIFALLCGGNKSIYLSIYLSIPSTGMSDM